MDVRCDTGETPLLMAVKKGHHKVAIELLDKGADVHAERSTGFGSLHIAAGRGDMKMAEILLHRGADIEAANEDGKLRALLFNGMCCIFHVHFD